MSLRGDKKSKKSTATLTKSGRYPLLLLIGFAAVFVWSAIAPRDRFTWWLEVLPSILGVPILILTYHRFQFTPLSYSLMWLLAVGTLIGGHYTYSEVPAFEWLKVKYNLERNYYDRVGHFVQGLGPAIIFRELLLRLTALRTRRWVIFLVTSVCLAQSALYELVEWTAAMTFGSGSTAFLGTQGDQWDAQWDMALALIGALVALLTMSRWHDRQLRGLDAH